MCQFCLILGSSKNCNAVAYFFRKLHRHVSQTADAENANFLPGTYPRIPQTGVNRNSAAQQRSRYLGIDAFGNRKSKAGIYHQIVGKTARACNN